jgi:hypothetical protein
MEQLFWQNNGNSILQHMQRFEDILIMSLRATERSVAISRLLPPNACLHKQTMGVAMTSFLRFLAKISNDSHKSRENYNYCRGLIYQTRKNGLNKLSPYSAVSK